MSILKRITLFLLPVILIAAIFSPNSITYATSYMQAATASNLRGIDVSHWDGSIDWQQVKNSGIAFAYLKASDGNSYTDSMFATNVQSARAVHMPLGAYHYARLTAPFNSDEPKLQAQNFVNVMKSNGLSDFGDIMPVLDLEEPSQTGVLSANEIAQWARIFVDNVKSLTNRQVMIYSGVWFIQQYNDFGGALSDIPIWIADWTRYGDPQPVVCGGWTTWTAWQYSDQGSVPGISSMVDLDYGPTSLTALRGDLSTPSAPAVPSSFTASNVTANSATLSWSAVSGASSYTLKRNGVTVYSGAATSYTDSGLSANTAYSYTLAASNAAGSSLPASLTLTTASMNVMVTSVTTDKSTYYSRSYAKINTAAKDMNGKAISGASVTLTIKNPYGNITTVSGKTDIYGNYVYSYYIPKKNTGTFYITANTSMNNYQQSKASTSFIVK